MINVFHLTDYNLVMQCLMIFTTWDLRNWTPLHLKVVHFLKTPTINRPASGWMGFTLRYQQYLMTLVLLNLLMLRSWRSISHTTKSQFPCLPTSRNLRNMLCRRDEALGQVLRPCELRMLSASSENALNSHAKYYFSECFSESALTFSCNCGFA